MGQTNSEIILTRNIKIDRNYINVLSYNESSMVDLCRKNAIAISNDYSFIRQNNNSLYTAFTYGQCIQANYIAFRNPDYSNKWFFAFIDDVIYTGDNNTEIRYTIDSWSTWFDYWQKQPCFINRQHVNDDTIGAHTVPENLDVGEVIEQSVDQETSFGEYWWVAISSSWNPADTEDNKHFSGITVYNNLVFGKKIYLVSNEQLVNVGLFIKACDKDGHVEDIDNIFIVPDAVVDPSKLEQHSGIVGGETYSFYELHNSFTPETFNININKTQAFNDYTPKNNKCFVYPYNFLYVSNNVGNDNIYRYEDFYSNTCQFVANGALCPGASVQITPVSYKHISYNFSESVALAKFPTCSWTSNAYINWLTQQAVNNKTEILGLGADIATASSVQEGITSVSGTIKNLIGGFYSASLLPNTTRGNNTGDVTFAMNANTFFFRHMRAKKEYLEIIDNYFSRFGYKINKVTTPNIIGRANWNYIEIGSSENIGYGSVPSKYMEEINNACRQGVTIWHNHANLGNYSIDNSIV